MGACAGSGRGSRTRSEVGRGSISAARGPSNQRRTLRASQGHGRGQRNRLHVGSANITAAGLAGRNLELGVVVYGAHVSVIDRILDLYQVGDSS